MFDDDFQRSRRDDIESAMRELRGELSPDDVDEAIRVLSAELRLRKKAAAIRADRALMAAVRERASELAKSSGRSRPSSED